MVRHHSSQFFSVASNYIWVEAGIIYDSPVELNSERLLLTQKSCQSYSLWLSVASWSGILTAGMVCIYAANRICKSIYLLDLLWFKPKVNLCTFWVGYLPPHVHICLLKIWLSVRSVSNQTLNRSLWKRHQFLLSHLWMYYYVCCLWQNEIRQSELYVKFG